MRQKRLRQTCRSERLRRQSQLLPHRDRPRSPAASPPGLPASDSRHPCAWMPQTSSSTAGAFAEYAANGIRAAACPLGGRFSPEMIAVHALAQLSADATMIPCKACELAPGAGTACRCGPPDLRWAVWLVQSLLLLDFVRTHSVDIPYLDDWEMVPVLTGGRPLRQPSWIFRRVCRFRTSRAKA